MKQSARCRLAFNALVSVLAVGGLAHAAPITSLFNTGTDASHASVADGTQGDAHYSLVTVAGDSTTNILARTSAGGYPIMNGGLSGDDAISTWIGPYNYPNDQSRHFGGLNDLTGPQGNYDYRTTFDLTGFDLSSASITGGWGTDNSGVDILLNGVSLGFTTPTNAFGSPLSAFTINSGFVAGVNSLDFVVFNGSGPTALRVEMTGSANPVPVPLPATASLLMWGLAMLGFATLRNRGVGHAGARLNG